MTIGLTVTLFVTKDLRRKEIPTFESTLSSFGVLKPVTGAGECGNTRCYTLVVDRKESAMLIELLKDIDCFCSYY